MLCESCDQKLIEYVKEYEVAKMEYDNLYRKIKELRIAQFNDLHYRRFNQRLEPEQVERLV